MRILELKMYGTTLGTREQGNRAQQEIEREIHAMSYGEKLLLDLDGVDVIGYSFADAAIALTIQRLTSREYGNKFILIKCSNNDTLEALEAALERRKLAALVVRNQKDSTGKNWTCLGMKKGHLVRTLEVIIRHKNVKTGELSKILGIELTNCNNRTAELYRLGLIERERVNDPSGGIYYINKSIIDR